MKKILITGAILLVVVGLFSVEILSKSALWSCRDSERWVVSSTTGEFLYCEPREPQDLGVARPAYLPRPDLTPAVTQQNLSETVCRCYGAKEKCDSYAKRVRPPVSWTAPRERESIKQYGYKDTDPSHYEYDHFVPISLGGAPKDIRNLWAQRFASMGFSIKDVKHTDKDTSFTVNRFRFVYGAKEKDRVEFFLYREMCSGRITLKEAQSKILNDWRIEYDKMQGTFGAQEEYVDPDDL